MRCWILLCLFLSIQFLSAQCLLKGIVVDESDFPLFPVNIVWESSQRKTTTDKTGSFQLQIPKENGNLILQYQGDRVSIPIHSGDRDQIDLGRWTFRPQPTQEELTPVFDSEDLEALTDALDRNQLGSVLNARKNPFLEAVAYQFSSSFFRLRGLNNSHHQVRLNGVEMNSFYTRQPQWGQWGGLNDFTNASQQFHFGIQGNSMGFGGFLGLTSLSLRPSDLRPGAKASLAFSNASYRFRNMFSYVVQPGEKGWGYAILVSRRWGKQGYVEGTLYDANAMTCSVEKQWNPQHSSVLTAVYTPQRRGKNAPMTQEVFDLKGRQYNPYWGFQQGVLRNSRESKIATPILLFNHYWQPHQNLTWQWNTSYSWGKIASGRMFYNGHRIVGQSLEGGGQNPDPIYYQYLPSYALRNPLKPDYTAAYLARAALEQQGQWPWEDIYQNNPEDATYALQEDVQQPLRFSTNVQQQWQLSPSLRWSSEVNYSREKSTFYATPTDLLGATRIWDLNPYAATFEQAQNDLLNPNRSLGVGAHFLYDYEIKTAALEISSRLNYSQKGWDAFFGMALDKRDYQRYGNFQNGNFPKHSWGPGEVHKFVGTAVKTGVNYALTGRHQVFINGRWELRPPAYRNLFFNPREHQFIVPNPHLEALWQIDLGYFFQSPKTYFKSVFYHISQSNLQHISFYFADGVGGDQALFVQEILTDVAQQHWGAEVAFQQYIVPELKLTAIAAVGKFVYANAPQLFLATAPSATAVEAGFDQGIRYIGRTRLKGLALPGGPQQAFSLSLAYEDPNYWRLSVYGNYFSNAFLAPNPLTRSPNFYTDQDGQMDPQYDADQAKEWLRQEAFSPYFLLNATAGKSWRIGSHYTGFFLSVQNLLNTFYKTGGYEQGRNANYRSFVEDRARSFPLFSPKYWWGRGTTYFTTFYYRF